jgi:hypothetical protein
MDQPIDEAGPSERLAARIEQADPVTRTLIELALASPDEPIPNGLSPSIRIMLEGVRAMIKEQAKQKPGE